MTKNLGKNVDERTKRNRLIWLLGQLATKMENYTLNQSIDLDGSQNSNEQYNLTQYKIESGKIIFEAYQAGEFRGNGTLCKVLDCWKNIPHSESTDWNYIQGFEAICWQWYGNRFESRRKELGELCAYAYVIRLLVGELEKENID